MSIPMSYEALRVIWWLLLGVLLTGFAIMDGFDLGAAICLPWIAKNDNERRVVINSIAPTWEGNQVWLILGAGAIFAAWPPLYAITFSGFYLAMLLVLLALIVRPVGLKFRSKLTSERWRKNWDRLIFISGLVPSLLFGVAVGNVLQGVPFQFDESLRMFYSGTLLQLLNPFALLCGVISLLMLSMHGALFIAVKTQGVLSQRGIKFSRIAAVSLIILFVSAGLLFTHFIPGYVISSNILHDAPSNPLHKTVITQLGAWLINFKQYPELWLIPGAAVIGCFFVTLLARRFTTLAFIFSAISIVGIVGTVGVSMFPFLLPSSIAPNASLLVWDSSSSQLTLFIMLVAAIIFLPIILLYTAFVYRVMRGKISESYITDNQHEVY